MTDPCADPTGMGRTRPTCGAPARATGSLPGPATTELFGALTTAPPGPLSLVRSGRSIGPYRLLEPLGAGRQAVVWHAVRDAPGGGPVALKLLTAAPRRDTDRCVARFYHEAARGARLVHRALLPVEDWGRDGEVVFLAMPLVPGETLGEILARRRAPAAAPEPIPWLAALPEPAYYPALAHVLARVARGLDAAHRQQVVHRDVKPENVLVAAAGRGGGYLIDFGIARDLDVARPEQLRDGAGTPLYMAPERLRGVPCDERRADLYSLGVTLYEAATLTRPFRVPDALDRRLWGWFLARQRPVPPRVARPGLPPALEAIIVRAMACAPQERYATAAALAAALERFGRPRGRVVARWARRRACRYGLRWGGGGGGRRPPRPAAPGAP